MSDTVEPGDEVREYRLVRLRRDAEMQRIEKTKNDHSRWVIWG